MLACREVSRMIASEDIGRAGWLRRLELRLHLMMCRHCRNYVHQVGLMGVVARRIWGIGAEDVEEATHIEGRVLEALREFRESKPRADGEPSPPRMEE